MPKAIFFDLDDTLLWDKKSIALAFHYTCKEAEKEFGVAAEDLEAAVRRIAPILYAELSTYSFTQSIGINPFEGLWGEFGDPIHHQFREMGKLIPAYRKKAWTEGLKALGIENPEAGEKLSERFREHRREQPVLYEETYEVLEALKKKSIRLLLLTNGAPSLQLEKLAITKELVPYFEHIVISGNVGVGKPSTPVFGHALRLMELSPEDVWMVGDNKKTDIMGANRIGMKSIWIQHDGSVGTGSPDEGKEDVKVKRLREVLELL
ncbi:HAD family hydrolase [Jeotgalibacillus soli]|uniref:Phosphoserine phosphatase n=1 Tax=Jeotgalibacillus soli TaxID=889306 RepID=A0A0C2W6A3_9BACL|nr:HAD family hydrolase [Jeotgalibacillus soli]KIL52101.1 HAD hydrolase, family IA [Jeotgalibacillus soli]